jgi:hypothetical protein
MRTSLSLAYLLDNTRHYHLAARVIRPAVETFPSMSNGNIYYFIGKHGGGGGRTGEGTFTNRTILTSI